MEIIQSVEIRNLIIFLHLLFLSAPERLIVIIYNTNSTHIAENIVNTNTTKTWALVNIDEQNASDGLFNFGHEAPLLITVLLWPLEDIDTFLHGMYATQKLNFKSNHIICIESATNNTKFLWKIYRKYSSIGCFLVPVCWSPQLLVHTHTMPRNTVPSARKLTLNEIQSFENVYQSVFRSDHMNLSTMYLSRGFAPPYIFRTTGTKNGIQMNSIDGSEVSMLLLIAERFNWKIRFFIRDLASLRAGIQHKDCFDCDINDKYIARLFKVRDLLSLDVKLFSPDEITR